MKHPVFLFAIIIIVSCKYDKIEPVPETGFPKAVENILATKCASEGCHNPQSRSAAAGLDFSTWNLMFDGGRNGTSVIPYSVDYSFMLYTVNTDTNRGPVLLPTMPYLQPQLSNAEYNTLVSWISEGAPDKNGYVKFSDDLNRKKVYVCMQGCDMVAVIDADSKVIMRYISVGNDPTFIEGPHQIRVSPDNKYWYVVFYSGFVLQKFSTETDELIATATLGSNSHPWNTLVFTPDGKTGYVNALDGRTQVVDLETMTPGLFHTFESPHGGFVTPDGNLLYLTCQNGNFVYRIEINNGFSDEKKSLVPGQQPINSSIIQPHEIILSPDGTKYFVTCQGSSEVRVMQLSNDSLLAVIPVGLKPQEMALSLTHPYLFVTCTEDPAGPNKKGNVYIINYNTLTFVPGSPVYTGFQPHGIAVDDEEGVIYVANLNSDANAPAPHHKTSCDGRNGNITIIDINTLTLYQRTLADGNSFVYKNEVLPFPYFVSIRK